MQNFDVLTFGSITLDILIKIPKEGPIQTKGEDTINPILQIPLGDKILAKEALSLCGGGAANSAIGFSKLGLNAAIFGVLGDQSNKGFIISQLREGNVNTDFITFAKNQTSSFSVILSTHNGERTVLHQRTTTPDFNINCLKTAPKAKALYMGHLYDKADDIILEIPHWKKQDSQRIFAWNPGKTQFNKGLKYYIKNQVTPEIDLLILNAEEAEAFTQKKSILHTTDLENYEIFGKNIANYKPEPVKGLRDVRAIAQVFLAAGIKKIIITDGGRGAQVFEKNTHYFVPSKNVKRIDTLGAGDAFGVGVLAGMIKGETTQTQALWGSENAASVLQHFGAQAGQLTQSQLS